jgi:maltose O-acetyltransferase
LLFSPCPQNSEKREILISGVLERASIYDNAPVHIGNRVLIGPGVCICSVTHNTDATIRREAGGSFAHPIRIGDDCWIGARATILPGVRIGEGSVIAAGAVVSRDVEAGSIVGGVPAKVLSRLEGEKRKVEVVECRLS